MSANARRIGRAMLDMLDSMADGREWSPRDLQAEIGTNYNLADKCRNMAARGLIEQVRDWTSPSGGVWRWYKITRAGRDALKLEIAMGRTPGVD